MRCFLLLIATIVSSLAITTTLGGSLDLHPSLNHHCPVVKYSSSVVEMSLDELSKYQLNQLQLDQLNEMKSTHSKNAFKVQFIPVSYIQNSTLPPVEWSDLHFRVGEQNQEDVKMQPTVKVVMAANNADSVSHSIFEYGPIFMSPSDELTFAYTIQSSMIDCNTPIHSFKPIEYQHEKEQAESAATSAAAAANQQLYQQAESIKLASSTVAPSELSASSSTSSPSSPSSPVSPSVSSTPPSTSQQPPVQSQPKQQQPQQSIEAMFSETAGCPLSSKSFDHRISCGDSNCKISFIPKHPVDWVDLHVMTDSKSFLLATGANIDVNNIQQRVSSPLVHQNFRMKFAIGESPSVSSTLLSLIPSSLPVDQHQQYLQSLQQQMEVDRSQLNSGDDVKLFGDESSPQKVLTSSHGGVQVFQFGLPLAFTDNDLLAVAFTYHPTKFTFECDTPIVKYQLRDDAKVKVDTNTNINKQQQQQPPLRVSLSSSTSSLPNQQQQQQQPSQLQPQQIRYGSNVVGLTQNNSPRSVSLPADLPYEVTITTRTQQAMVPPSILQ